MLYYHKCVCLEVSIIKADFWNPPLNSNLSLLGSFISDGRTRLQTSSIKMVEHSLPSERFFVFCFFFNGLHYRKRASYRAGNARFSAVQWGSGFLAVLQACFKIVSKSLTCHLSLFISRMDVCVRL